MSDQTWDQFVVRIAVDADKDALYSAWATRQGIEHWFLRMSDYRAENGDARQADEPVQVGDTYSWRWHGWPDDVEEHGKILAANGRDHFRFTFGDAGICDVRIKDENGYRVVELVQTDIPDDEHGKQYWHVGCRTGWTFYLTNMKSLFEGGIDLRNKDEGLKGVVNA